MALDASNNEINDIYEDTDLYSIGNSSASSSSYTSIAATSTCSIDNSERFLGEIQNFEYIVSNEEEIKTEEGDEDTYDNYTPDSSTILDLTNCNLSNSDLWNLSKQIADDKTVKEIRLEGLDFIDREVYNYNIERAEPTRLIRIVKTEKVFEKVDWSLFSTLCRSLRKNYTYRFLNLNNISLCRKGQEGCVELCNAILDRPNLPKMRSKLFALELANNFLLGESAMRYTGIKKIRDVLSVNHNLVKLNLNGNNIHSEGVKFLAQGFSAQHGNPLLYLDLGNNNVGRTADSKTSDAGIKALVDWINGYDCKLITLNLSNNNIANEESIILAQALGKVSKLEELYLAKNNIMVMGANAFGKALALHDKLRVLDLSENSLFDEGTTLLSSKIMVNSTLKILRLDKVGITYLGIDRITYNFQKNHALTEVSLKNNILETHQLEKIAWAIAANQLLDSLSKDPVNVDVNLHLPEIREILVHKLEHLPKDILFTMRERNVSVLENKLIYEQIVKLVPFTKKEKLERAKTYSKLKSFEGEGAQIIRSTV